MGRIFISYRRSAGSLLANLVYERLKPDHYVFIDVERMDSGPFDKTILSKIDSSTHLIAVLTRGCLDRCKNDPRDWLRLEIAHAIQNGVSVVPVMEPDFEWPLLQELPEELATLPKHHGVRYSHEYPAASLERLQRLLSSSSRPLPIPSWKVLLALVAAIAIAVVGFRPPSIAREADADPHKPPGTVPDLAEEVEEGEHNNGGDECPDPLDHSKVDMCIRLNELLNALWELDQGSQLAEHRKNSIIIRDGSSSQPTKPSSTASTGAVDSADHGGKARKNNKDEVIDAARKVFLKKYAMGGDAFEAIRMARVAHLDCCVAREYKRRNSIAVGTAE